MTRTEDELAVGRLVESLATGDRPGLVSVLDGGVHLRALLPRRSVDVTGAGRVADELLGWFEEVPEIVAEWTAVQTVGDLWHAGFRFSLRAIAVPRVVEQHAYCTVASGTITAIRLVCSGFRPVPEATPVPEPAGELDALGDGCATLTPRIAATMRQLAPGDVLAVLSDDPSAAEGIAAWSRLTGHEIVASVPEGTGTRFYVRHC